MEKIECKYCKGKGVSKNGYARKKQRYKCKSCNKNFTEGDGRKNWKYGNKERSMVIKMYLNNCGIRRIAHILNIPLSTVFYWIKQAGKVVDEMVTNQKIEGDKKRIEILEMDELYTYVKKKENKTRIWTAVDRDRFKTVAFKVGSGDKENYVDLARELGEKYQIRYMCTDGYEVYCHYKIAQIHLQTKSETCLVESFNSSLRDMLARLNRKTKRFSKCSEMLRLSLVLFFNKALALSIYL